MDNINTAGDMTAFVNDLSYLVHRTTVESFSDDFSGVSLNSAWSPTGSYSVVGNTLNGTNAAGYLTAARTNTAPDSQLKVSLKKTSSLNSIRLYVRSQNSNNQVWVETWGTAMQIVQRVGGVNTTLDNASITTNLNTWYDYHIISDGKRVEVWRGPQGGTTELILETDACTVPASTRFTLHAWTCTAGFDNVEFITNDPVTQAMAYNGANELTSSVVGAITTTYTYDQHGRTISKADGTHSARYIWFAGDKLKQYESDFPGESDVAYNYDALGKRRVKLVNLSAPTDADYTWYRWDAGWNMIGEYAAGSDLATTWDVGLPMLTYITSKHSGGGTFLLGLNSLISLYPAIDRLGTARAILNNSQERVSIFEYKPFGSKYLSVSVSDSTSYARLNFDDTTGMYYALNRYYSPVTARWISGDPLGSIEGPNLYRYSLNNPTLYADPMGTKSIITPEDIPPWVGKACGEKSADWDDNAIIKCLQLAARDGNSDYCHNACSCIVEHVNTDILTLPRCMNCCHSGEANGGIPGKSCTGCGVVPPHESRKGDILFCLLIAFLLVLCRRRSNDRACCHEDD